jgi:hypothetical protein
MFDNITVNDDGSLILQEDVGTSQHNGKIWIFDPAAGSLVKLAGFDPALFGDVGVVGSITKDEEASGVIYVTDILDRDGDKVLTCSSPEPCARRRAETVEAASSCRCAACVKQTTATDTTPVTITATIAIATTATPGRRHFEQARRGDGAMRRCRRLRCISA